MQITLKITEDSKVELVKDNYELVQGECCFTDFVFNFPAKIKDYSINEYTKFIEFAECKEIGECVKFVDEIKGNKYELHEACTAFKKIMVQIVLERVSGGKKITWKTLPFTLEFVESINANGTTAIQTQLLNLVEIRDKWEKDLEDTKDEWEKDLEDTKDEWETFINANCLRMVYSASGVPLANAGSEGKTIFYLGENTGDFTYGHYYRCTSGAWRDLTQDPSLEGVANGVREINKSRTMQLWVGKSAELSNKTPLENVVYVPEDIDTAQAMKSVLGTMAGDNNFITLPNGKKIIIADKNEFVERKKRLTLKSNAVSFPDGTETGEKEVILSDTDLSGKKLEIAYIIYETASSTAEECHVIKYVTVCLEKGYNSKALICERKCTHRVDGKGILKLYITSKSGIQRLCAEISEYSYHGGMDCVITIYEIIG